MNKATRYSLLVMLALAVLVFGCARTQAEQPVEVAKVDIPLSEVVRDSEAPQSITYDAPEDVDFTVPQAAEALPGKVVPSEPEMPIEAGKPVAQAKEPETKEIPKRDYSELLKDPKELGFSPSENLFRHVYYQIKQSFVEDVSEERLFQGVKDEVKNLLEQAKVPTTDLDKLSQGRKVLPQLVDLYGDRVDKDLLVFSAILGMLDGLDDNYSLLLTPEDYSKLQEQMQAREFGGIGIYIELDKDDGNRLTVFEPIEGTPAYTAGLEAGDKILAIDDKDTKGITLDAAQSAIRGPVGTDVVLTVNRPGFPQPKKFPITRGNIHVVSVTHKMLPGKIGYVRLRMFGSQTATELEDSLRKLKAQGMTSLIMDLRNNGGGYIDASVSVVGQFLKQDDGLVVYTIDRNKRRRDYRASRAGHFSVPMVVLINKFSASASEITAGALRDHKVAKLVGEHSFGKGSVQQLYPFSDGAALKLTIAKFYTPAGTVINKVGIEPDTKLEMEPRFVGRGEKDTQLKKAIELLKG
ncbi:MAG: S41 family peptidase [Vulcanimicrobiota bacterium]